MCAATLPGSVEGHFLQCDGSNGQGRRTLNFQPILAIIIESVSWLTEDFLWDNEWITETKVTMKENLILEVFDPCASVFSC